MEFCRRSSGFRDGTHRIHARNKKVSGVYSETDLPALIRGPVVRVMLGDVGVDAA